MRRLIKLLAWGLVVSVVMILAAHVMVEWSAEGRTFTKIEDVVGEPRVAVVLGCSKTLPNGNANRFFPKRISAAVELFKSGRSAALIVSGDNSRPDYDEPTMMKEALVAAGVPADRIYCDYAGFRTLDSMVRAKEIFSQQRIIVVSQRFHNERAIYLARSRGIDALGFNAQDPDLTRLTAIKNVVREALARVAALIDAHVFRTQPRFLGPQIRIDPDSGVGGEGLPR